MDLNEQMGSKEPDSPSPQVKSCSDCHTTRTPLWRGGPAGPKSLCNACGIKYNKKRRQMLGLDRGRNEKGKKRRKSGGGGGDGAVSSGGSTETAKSLRMRWMALEGETALRRSEKLLSQLREEEQAAILLMALSYGSVYA
ncbi:PREDICTED: GATA transcription factor 16-like [Ipomoea nil]|uniref:GATA transcription factor 16-like n=1 Tax=Ipomoea nil TaxID=35883 RepID=UPI000901C27A|nr:PREDICTED: GATA transcription factor 16-like [Ipomoea nil]